MRGERATPDFLAAWKARGATDIVVPLDEATKPGWGELAARVERAGLTLWPWVEVARNPSMAVAHPRWMAAVGGHHDDWRQRFPQAPQKSDTIVIKAWPWVPLGYVEPFQAHRDRIGALLADLPGAWPGVLLNDLQGGPSSCGCGNDQCRWALDYGAPATAARAPESAAAQLLAELKPKLPGKTIVPVWVTECEPIDVPGAEKGTGYCGSVACATGTCWPSYARDWNRLREQCDGPNAVALWSGVFRRDPEHWPQTAVDLFRNPPRGARALDPEKSIAVVQAWDLAEGAIETLQRHFEKTGGGWLLALDPIEQSWEPRAVAVAD